MPRIPTYTPQKTNWGRLATGGAPVPRAPTPVYADASVFASASGQAAGELAKVGKAAAKVAEAFHKARQVTELNNAQVETLKKVTDWEKQLDNRSDFDAWEPEFNELVDKIRKDYRERIKDDAVIQALDLDLTKLHLKRSVKVRHRARKKMIEYGKASFAAQERTYLELYAVSDEDERADIEKRFQVATFEHLKTGHITAPEAEQRIANFQRRTDRIRAEQALRTAPEQFNPDDYAHLTPEDRVSLSDHALRIAESRRKERIRQESRAEKEAEKEHERLLEENEYELWRKFHAGALTVEELENMARARRIDKDGYNALRKALDKDDDAPATNNPVVLGELGEKLERGIDIRRELKQALKNHQIKPETYATMLRQSTQKAYKQGLAFVSSSLRPSAADKWDIGKHSRYANAVDEYNRRVADGEDPDEVSHDIVRQYIGQDRNLLRQAVKGYRRPRFLQGDIESLPALDAAATATRSAFLAGRITEQEYDREAWLIQEIRQTLLTLSTLDRTDKAPPSDPRIRTRLKQMKKGNP